MMMKKRIFWLVLTALACAALLIHAAMFDATADGKPYSVSLNSSVTFPVDI